MANAGQLYQGQHLGKQFGNYRLVKLLGEGGFAEVYLGEQIYLGTQAAVKVLTARLTSDEPALPRVRGTTLYRCGMQPVGCITAPIEVIPNLSMPWPIAPNLFPQLPDTVHPSHLEGTKHQCRYGMPIR